MTDALFVIAVAGMIFLICYVVYDEFFRERAMNRTNQNKTERWQGHVINHLHVIMEQNDCIIEQNRHILCALKLDDASLAQIAEMTAKLKASGDALIKDTAEAAS